MSDAPLKDGDRVAELGDLVWVWTGLWVVYFVIALMSPFCCFLLPKYKTNWGARVIDHTICSSALLARLAELVPFLTIFIDMMQVAAVGFLPAIGWSGGDNWGPWQAFFRWWAFGLAYDGGPGPAFQTAFFICCVVSVCCVCPCARIWQSYSESHLAALFTSTIAMTLFFVIFSGLACSRVDALPTNGAALRGLGDGFSVRSDCDKGFQQLVGAVAIATATLLLCVCTVQGVVSMDEDEWPRGVYAFFFDTFVNRCFLAQWAAVLGFSADAGHGRGLARLLLAVTCCSLGTQLVLRPALPRSGREYTCRLTSELFKVVVAVAANMEEDTDGSGNMLLVFGIGATLVLAFLSVTQLCCCCQGRDETRTVKVEFNIITGATGGPAVAEEAGA